mgnify:CR=1 FL=1
MRLHLHTGFLALGHDLTVGEARTKIKTSSLKREPLQTVYYYVVDAEGHLQGILGLEALAMANDTELVAAVMQKDVFSLRADETTEGAVRLLMLSMLRAVPVTDENGVLLGIIAYEQISESIIARRANPSNNSISRETIQRDLSNLFGFKNDDAEKAGVLGAFRIRTPWLLATVSAGVICTMAIDRYSNLLAHFAFVVGAIPIALGLADAICHQASSIAVLQHLGDLGSLGRLRRAFVKEVLTALMIAAAAGVLICLLCICRHEGIWPSFVIAFAISISIVCGGIYGHLVPVVLRLLKCNPHVSGGPIALAMTDLSATLILLEVSRLLIG